MNVLIGGERSGVIRDAFRLRGHNAYSCDLVGPEPSLYQQFHYRMDVRKALLKRRWDLFIVHPDCQFLAASGLHWNHRIRGRALKTEEALDFVREMLAASAVRICLENPKGAISTRIRKPTQTIQPYQFGEDASKATCLWLVNLPPLLPTYQVPPRFPCLQCKRRWPGVTYGVPLYVTCPVCGGEISGKGVWANQAMSGQNNVPGSSGQAMRRARTYPGIARAMADQWGAL